MAKRSQSKKKSDRLAVRPELIGLVLLALALLTGLSVLSITRGAVTEQWLLVLNALVGLGRYLVPLVLAGIGIWLLRRFAVEDAHEKWEKPVGAVVLFVLLLAFFHIISPGEGLPNLENPGGGGLVGWTIGELLISAFGVAGSVVLLTALAIVCLILISGLSMVELYNWGRDRRYMFSDWQRRRTLSQVNHQPVSPLPIDEVQQVNLLQRVFGPRSQHDPLPASPTPGLHAGALPASSSEQASSNLQTGQLQPRVVGAQSWQLPPLETIFEEGAEHEVSHQEIREQVRIIEETLASFGIEAKVREYNQGPAVTQFGVEPGYMSGKDAKGNPRKVRVSRIVNLANDLALALSASPIRIEAPIPGRPYVGIEVPNATKSLVSLRSMMESDAYRNVNWALRFALGRDVSGQPIVADLAAMPHLLIAGATGSGKSVCVNAIVAGFLATHTPETLRLLLIDPKMVEMINYTSIPHLLAPVVVELERVVGVLNWATREMERRYKTFSKVGVRNLVGYNEMMANQGEKTMPYIVIIIDELADLMMTAPDEIERTVTRIAQMARATGIHLIIATQRPSVNVVTGLIKANFPARIAFAVTSQIDSRVILDGPGAERLLGRGDMLFMAPDSSKLQRLQGAFVSDRELARLVAFWKGSYAGEDGLHPGPTGARTSTRPEPITGPAIQTSLWAELDGIEDDHDQGTSGEDDMYVRAVQIVRTQRRASISLLQRRLRVGYARAARLIDTMEEQGIIGPDEGGGRSRQVLLAESDNTGEN